MMFVAVAIKLESRGPILFRQTRIGLGGRLIHLFKFRTMYLDAPDDEIRSYKIESDPRITRIGRFLRYTSIDELPQIFNVLKGELSVVGPRPALPFELEKYTAEQLERFNVPPGLTGLWQVSGIPRADFEKMMELDLSYVRQRCIWLDLKIIFRTLSLAVRGGGAY
jgi:lipopolysaccharide/colanic/teichoic acid biosynthesis glycosyltransferase